ncbi:MAG: hypothetical protein RL701_7477 [Pseudomonadota bacterium]
MSFQLWRQAVQHLRRSRASRLCVLGSAWLCLSVFAARLALDAGVTWDEPVQLEYGNLILAWFRSGFVDRGAMVFNNLYLYGGLFDLPAQWLVEAHWLPWGPYETRHVLAALVAVLGLAATYGVGERVTGPRAGLFAAATLALTPTWLGHGLFNPKDIPFGTAVACVAYASVRIAMLPSILRYREAVIAGLSVGAALGVRPGGMFLCAFPAIAALGRAGLAIIARRQQLRPIAWFAIARALFMRLSCALVIAWVVMLITWPWAQLQPLTGPFKAAAEARHFQWLASMLFRRAIVFSDDLPWTYLPTWFAITMPEIYVLAAVGGIVSVLAWRWHGPLRWDRTLALLVLSALVIVPVLGVFATRPVLYDAHRHFLFLWPPLAAVCGVIMAHVVAHPELPTWFRRSFGAVWCGLALLVIADMIALHPYQYVYFNRLSGGLATEYSRYETDYWGATYREGLAWVVQSAHERDQHVRVSGCYGSEPALAYYLARWHEERVVWTGDGDTADVYLATTRFGCDLKATGKVVHTVSRQGAPLLYVFDRRGSQ